MDAAPHGTADERARRAPHPPRPGQAANSGNDPITRAQAQLQSLLGDPVERTDGEADGVDVRDYLLDPPPSDAEQARREQVRRRVRIGSIVASAIVAVALLVPLPSTSGTDDPATTQPPDDIAPTATPRAAVATARRLDAPHPAPRPAAARSPRTARSAAPPRATRRPTAPATPAPPTPAAARPAPAATTPASGTGGSSSPPRPTAGNAGTLVPVM